MSPEERELQRRLKQLCGQVIADAWKAYDAAGKNLAKMKDAKQRSIVQRHVNAWKAYNAAGKNLAEMKDAKQKSMVERQIKGKKKGAMTMCMKSWKKDIALLKKHHKMIDVEGEKILVLR